MSRCVALTSVQADVDVPCFLAPSVHSVSINVQPKAMVCFQLCINQDVARGAYIL